MSPVRSAGTGRESTVRVRWGPVLRKLARYYRTGSWKVPVLRDRNAPAFRVLVSTILSQRTQDVVTERATERLLVRFPTVESLAVAEVRDVQGTIAQVGLSDEKAAGLRLLAKIVQEKHGGQVPVKKQDLLDLPLVGSKTASAVLVFAFGIDAIPVDTHIMRVANRLGAVETASIEETEHELERVVPQRYWKKLNPALVQHGQNLCTARSPKCGSCPILKDCARVGVAQVTTGLSAG